MNKTIENKNQGTHRAGTSTTDKGNTRVYIDWVNRITSNTLGDNQAETINKGTTKLDTGNTKSELQHKTPNTTGNI